MDNLTLMMNELDFTSPSAFPMLFAFKQTDASNVIQLGQAVGEQYKKDKTDTKIVSML